MSADRTFKLSAQLDVSDVSRKSDEVVQRMNRMADAANRATRNVGLATDPMEFFREKTPYSAVQRTTGPSLAGQVASETEKLASAQLKLRNLSRVLGFDGLGVGLLRLREIASVVSQLAAAGPAGIVAGLGAALGAGAVAFATYKVREIYRLRSETVESQTGNNEGTLTRILERIREGRASGKLRGGEGADLEQQAVTLLQQNGIASRSSSMAAGMISRNVQSQIPELLKEVESRLGESYKTQEGGALEHARQMAQIQEAQNSNEKERLKEKLSLGLLTTEDYYAKLQVMARKSAEAEKGVLDLRESQLRSELERGGLDADQRAQIRNDLDSISNARKLNSYRLYGEQDRIDNDRLRALSGRSNTYRMPVDELSRIGLFVGGSADNLPELSKQQVQELRRINERMAELPSQIAGYL